MAAIDAFGTRGYGATSLDDLARELGIRKQTILYWYPSKEALLDAAVDRTAVEVTVRLERAVAAAGEGFARVEAIVRAMFRLAARHPSMLGFLREVTRLGPAGLDPTAAARSRRSSTGRPTTWPPRWTPGASAATIRASSCWRPTRWSRAWPPRSRCCGRSARSRRWPRWSAGATS